MKLIDKLKAIGVDPKKVDPYFWQEQIDLILEIEALSLVEVTEIMIAYGDKPKRQDWEESVIARENLKKKGFLVETVSSQFGFQNACTQKGYYAALLRKNDFDAAVAIKQSTGCAVAAGIEEAKKDSNYYNKLWVDFSSGYTLSTDVDNIPGRPKDLWQMMNCEIIDNGKTIYWPDKGYKLNVDYLVRSALSQPASQIKISHAVVDDCTAQLYVKFNNDKSIAIDLCLIDKFKTGVLISNLQEHLKVSDDKRSIYWDMPEGVAYTVEELMEIAARQEKATNAPKTELKYCPDPTINYVAAVDLEKATGTKEQDSVEPKFNYAVVLFDEEALQIGFDIIPTVKIPLKSIKLFVGDSSKEQLRDDIEISDDGKVLMRKSDGKKLYHMILTVEKVLEIAAKS